jgi:phenylalanyl-tRNA synthetase beta chain
MKFTLSWLKDHLETTATVPEIVAAMTMAGLEVEHVIDPATKLAPFTVCKIVEAVQHPNADRLRVCQVDTVDGRKEIVCGAPNARAGLTTIYAPIGAYVPGLDVTLVEKPVRGVVSNGMLCSAAELEYASESDGIMELPDALPVGTPAVDALGLEAVIDFEVTPNRPDWLGVVGIARDLAAAGVGKLKDVSIAIDPRAFPRPITVKVDGDACPVFAGRYIRGVKNGPSPKWLADRLTAIGLRPISALVDITNLITYDRARPLHVYDVAKLVGTEISTRLGRHGVNGDEHLIALDGKTYELTPGDVGDRRRLGRAPDRPGRRDGRREHRLLGRDHRRLRRERLVRADPHGPDRPRHRHRQRRPVPLRPHGRHRLAGPRHRAGHQADPRAVRRRAVGSRCWSASCPARPGPCCSTRPMSASCRAWRSSPRSRCRFCATSASRSTPPKDVSAAAFVTHAESAVCVTPPTFRRDVEGKADLVEEVARIAGYGALPSTPLPEVGARGRRHPDRQAGPWPHGPPRPGGHAGYGSGDLQLHQPQDRRAVRRRSAGAAAGQSDRLGTGLHAPVAAAQPDRGGRPQRAPRLPRRGPVRDRPDLPWRASERPAHGGLGHPGPEGPRGWDKAAQGDVFTVKADLLALLEELGAPVASLQTAQGSASSWWHPGRSARLQLGPKAVMAEFGEIHPAVLKALDVAGPVYGFEITLEAIPEPKKKAIKTRPAFSPSALMPLTRDFAFVVEKAKPAGDLVKAAVGADKALITAARVFDVYEGPGVPDGFKSVAIEVVVQPREATLTDAEIAALSAKVVAAAEKAGGKLRS